ncbi:hypothetical protein AB3M83_00650 [Microbacterium sp. 179-B 1A2 NHS]|uniref:hypothetical protein n=1 Tax=Microbacterium sp. 179-B 1A2 NHS TaxID=3142383 RepID=UPI0039A07CFD
MRAPPGEAKARAASQRRERSRSGERTSRAAAARLTDVLFGGANASDTGEGGSDGEGAPSGWTGIG